ncbi:MAG: lactate utilization protein [Clostridia bacterium]|nr:lactate utilization protein [Clostridia bacterium]
MDFAKVKSNLEKLGYVVTCFDTKNDASKYLNKTIDHTSVGICGTLTVEEMGLYESLGEHNEVHWHWRPGEGETPQDVRERIAKCDIFISSVNGLAETGEIVNIDGRGDRVANTIHGHKKVYFIVGENKIAENFEKALWRARNIAAPLNAKRLNRKTPCAVKGDKCYDCSSPDRICNALTVLWRKPYSMEYEIVLVHENLGY